MGRQKIEVRWRWAKKFVETASNIEPEALLQSVYETMVSVAEGGRPKPQHREVVEPPHGWNDPWLMGAIHEQAVSAAERRKRGAWYTPQKLVVGLVRFGASEAELTGTTKIIDPTCGGGAFLLAAADYLVEQGRNPSSVYRSICGQDIDALAVQVTRWALSIWATNHGVSNSEQPALRCGDALHVWPVAEGCDQFVVGNPPFASPLRSGALPETAIRFRQQNEGLLGPYADLAAIHLVRAKQMVSAKSTIVLVQPQSVLSSRDTEPLRAHLDENMPLSGLWVAREVVFDAGVRACAPVFQTTKNKKISPKVRLASGRDVEPQPAAQHAPWPCLAADALGAPKLPDMGGQLAEAGVTATAGFRDEYYGLAEACVEVPPVAKPATASSNVRRNTATQQLKLITVGLIDPLENRWGTDQVRFAGKKWTRPSVSLDDLDPKTASWTKRQLHPKLLVATQARVLEPIIDRDGSLVPVTPVLSVQCSPEKLDRVAAVLLAPPVVAWAWRTWFGAALSVDAVKLSAKQLLQLPVPTDQQKWTQAAELIATTDQLGQTAVQQVTTEVASIMTDAYKAERGVFNWWLERRG